MMITKQEIRLQEIMSELKIVHHNTIHTDMCNSNPMNFQKRGEHMKMASYIGKVSNRLPYLTLLRYVGGFYYIQFVQKKTSHNPKCIKNGGLTSTNK